MGGPFCVLTEIHMMALPLTFWTIETMRPSEISNNAVSINSPYLPFGLIGFFAPIGHMVSATILCINAPTLTTTQSLEMHLFLHKNEKK